jgi:hypothetical protein
MLARVVGGLFILAAWRPWAGITPLGATRFYKVPGQGVLHRGKKDSLPVEDRGKGKNNLNGSKILL